MNDDGLFANGVAQLRIERFRGVTAPTEVDLDADVVLITGPNGVGKTTIIDALNFALCWQPTNGDAHLAHVDTRRRQQLLTHAAKTLALEVVGRDSGSVAYSLAESTLKEISSQFDKGKVPQESNRARLCIFYQDVVEPEAVPQGDVTDWFRGDPQAWPRVAARLSVVRHALADMRQGYETPVPDWAATVAARTNEQWKALGVALAGVISADALGTIWPSDVSQLPSPLRSNNRPSRWQGYLRNLFNSLCKALVMPERELAAKAPGRQVLEAWLALVKDLGQRSKERDEADAARQRSTSEHQAAIGSLTRLGEGSSGEIAVRVLPGWAADLEEDAVSLPVGEGGHLRDDSEALLRAAESGLDRAATAARVSRIRFDRFVSEGAAGGYSVQIGNMLSRSSLDELAAAAEEAAQTSQSEALAPITAYLTDVAAQARDASTRLDALMSALAGLDSALESFRKHWSAWAQPELRRIERWRRVIEASKTLLALWPRLPAPLQAEVVRRLTEAENARLADLADVAKKYRANLPAPTIDTSRTAALRVLYSALERMAQTVAQEEHLDQTRQADVAGAAARQVLDVAEQTLRGVEEQVQAARGLQERAAKGLTEAYRHFVRPFRGERLLHDAEVKVETASAKGKASAEASRLLLQFAGPNGQRVPFDNLSTGQRVAALVALTWALNVMLSKRIGHRVLAFDDFLTSLDLGQIPAVATVLRALAYGVPEGVGWRTGLDAPPGSPRRQIIITSHHEDGTNQLLRWLQPPPGRSLTVLDVREWKSGAPEIVPYSMKPRSASVEPEMLGRAIDEGFRWLHDRERGAPRAGR